MVQQQAVNKNHHLARAELKNIKILLTELASTTDGITPEMPEKTVHRQVNMEIWKKNRRIVML